MSDLSAFQLLQKHQLRSTPTRRTVIAALSDAPFALTQAELEAANRGDRITLYRTLKSFEDVGLIHRVADSTGQAKYALCGANCTPTAHAHTHPHFQCDDCGNTYCLPEGNAPVVVLPKGYHLQEIHITYQGSCASCNSLAHV